LAYCANQEAPIPLPPSKARFATRPIVSFAASTCCRTIRNIVAIPAKSLLGTAPIRSFERLATGI
jgi:hypothetical protein